MDDDRLVKRYSEIARNMAALVSEDRYVIPIRSFLSAWYWYRKEHQTRYAAPFLIRIRKMRSDVAHSGGAEQRIANRMAQNISIGMANRTFFKGDFDAANHEFAFLREPVKVVADSGA